MEIMEVNTPGHTCFVNITEEVQERVRRKGIISGVLTLFVPHTTAGITINENADPDVVRDILEGLQKAVPDTGLYAHREGNSPAHIKAGLMGFSQHLVIDGGQVLLGTWQGIYLCEFDGPRTRRVVLKMTGE
ncbi:MAG: secondary thiamine-phosphate synthase enzyme YjbQ [Clostridia bacterium]